MLEGAVKRKGGIHSTSEHVFISRQIALDPIQCPLFLSHHNQNDEVDLKEYLENTRDDFLLTPSEGGRILSLYLNFVRSYVSKSVF